MRQVGAELFHAYRWTDGQADRRTDMMKLIIASLKFANAPKNEMLSTFYLIFCSLCV
jgi:hypothetical protein